MSFYRYQKPITIAPLCPDKTNVMNADAFPLQYAERYMPPRTPYTKWKPTREAYKRVALYTTNGLTYALENYTPAYANTDLGLIVNPDHNSLLREPYARTRANQRVLEKYNNKRFGKVWQEPYLISRDPEYDTTKIYQDSIDLMNKHLDKSNEVILTSRANAAKYGRQFEVQPPLELELERYSFVAKIKSIFGVKESYTKDGFDGEVYVNLYPDLKAAWEDEKNANYKSAHAAAKTKKEWGEYHWKKWGEKEGRISGVLPLDFDGEVYVDLNSDLKAAWEDENNKYYKHAHDVATTKKEWGLYHWLNQASKNHENRYWSEVPEDFRPLEYMLTQPELVPAFYDKDSQFYSGWGAKNSNPVYNSVKHWHEYGRPLREKKDKDGNITQAARTGRAYTWKESSRGKSWKVDMIEVPDGFDAVSYVALNPYAQQMWDEQIPPATECPNVEQWGKMHYYLWGRFDPSTQIPLVNTVIDPEPIQDVQEPVKQIDGTEGNNSLDAPLEEPILDEPNYTEQEIQPVEKNSTWWIVLLIVLLVIAIAGTVTTVMIKRKKINIRTPFNI